MKKTSQTVQEVPPPYNARVLAVTPRGIDRQLLQLLFQNSGWALHFAGTHDKALALVKEHEIPVVITEEKLPRSDWKQFRARLEIIRPETLLVVTGSNPDINLLYSEVVTEGGYNVVSKPFDQQEVFQVVNAAWRRVHCKVR